MPNGHISEENQVFLNELYLESINARYVRPLNYEYYKSLNRPLSQRLYELLGVKLYGAFQNNSLSVRYSYCNLCQLLPMSPKPYLSQTKQKMTPAHKELIKTGFLDSVKWDEWTIYFHAGERAIEEIEVLS